MANHKTGAVAIFVKTPGLSPIKTRLAAAIGKSAAEWFHLMSAKAVESVVLRASHADGALSPYWAVAEKEALDSPHWHNFESIWQGEGSLGERLSHVYGELIERHPFVIIIGADSPQITCRLLEESALVLSRSENATFVMGKTEDGGFYLFGGSTPVTRDVWIEVEYSTAATAAELAKKIEPLGRINELPKLFDVDTVDDMVRLLQSSAGNFDLTLEQCTLLKWVEEYFAEKK